MGIRFLSISPLYTFLHIDLFVKVLQFLSLQQQVRHKYETIKIKMKFNNAKKGRMGLMTTTRILCGVLIGSCRMMRKEKMCALIGTIMSIRSKIL